MYSFYNALEDSNTILLLGSSELTQQDPNKAMPFNFIPNHTHYDVLGIGHAGNQSFSIFTQLLSGHEFLKNSKVVFIISPSWFLKKYCR